MQYTRQEVIERIKTEMATGRPILTAGAGVGISAKCAEIGGADLIVVYNSGKFRMNGHSSMSGLLAFSDANQVVYELGERVVLPVVQRTPVVAGVFGIDPTRDLKRFIASLKGLGYSGVINFPTVGRIDGNYRRDLEQVGFTLRKEVDMLKMAQELDLFTMAYVFKEEDAVMMAIEGVDCIVAHLGVTVGGDVGVDDSVSLESAVGIADTFLNSAMKANPDIIPLVHGGPIATVEDVRYVLERSVAAGFVAASTIERLPVEKAIISATQDIKSMKG